MVMEMADLVVDHLEQQVPVYYEKYADQIKEGQTIQ
jgi:hypothetical protein